MSVIEADKSICEGIGMCEAQADDYFQVGDDGLVEILTGDVPDPDRGYVKAAVDSCPVAALRLQG